MQVSLDDKIEIAKHLDSSHSLFRKFWDLGEPKFTKKIPTAAVTFDETGEFVDFLFNEDFWNKLSAYDRAFVTAHEMLHIILEHGFRINSKNSDKEIANKAMDICVNSLLVNQFNFEKDKLKVEEVIGGQLCWFENIFGANCGKVKKNREAEYYYNILMKLKKEHNMDVSAGAMVLDSHLTNEKAKDLLDSLLPGAKDEILGDKKVAQIISKYTENESNTEMNEICNMAGIGEGTWQQAEDKKTAFSRKWNRLIKKKDLDFYVDDFVDEESFTRRNRRMEFILENVLIPTDISVEKKVKDKEKTRLLMFLDTSGSCMPFMNDFFLAYRTIDKRRFDIRIYSFDTVVKPIDVDNCKIHGGGGTDFKVIEKEVQRVFHEEHLLKQPFVFVLTDGFGTAFNPVAPQNWFWFLSNNGSPSLIPKLSKHYKIQDFVL